MPFEIYNEQKSLIDSREPSKLNIFVGPAPLKGWNLERDILGAYLTVISMEQRKIIELYAEMTELLYRNAETSPNIAERIGVSVKNFYFEWSNVEATTEIIPGAVDEFLVASIRTGESCPSFGMSLASPNNCEGPAIFYVKIRLKGKLEGDVLFSYYDYEGQILFEPRNDFLILEFVTNLESVPEDMRKQLYLFPEILND
jgi:hypothetical protein